MDGATLAEWKRKRDEGELARQREREERLANGPFSYRLAGMAYQRSLDNFRETLLEGGFSAEEVKALKSEVVSNGYIPSAKEMVKERKEEEASREAARQDYREGERGGDDEKVAAWLAAEEARKAEETQAGLLAYYQGRKAGETPVTPVKETNWLSNLWNAGTTALAGILSTQKETVGGGKLAALLLQDPEPPEPSGWQKFFDNLNKLFTENKNGQQLVQPATEEEILNFPYDAAMQTYIAIGINVQHGGTNNPWDDTAGNGPAQLTRVQLDTPYGEGYDCKNGECRGYGLGLSGADPFDDDVAVKGMKNRIQQVMEEAEKLGNENDITLDETDRFIIAAQSQNGGGFDKNDIQNVMKNYTENGKIDWENYFKDKETKWDASENSKRWWDYFLQTGGNDYDTQYMLERFYNEASALQENEYYLPENLNTDKIENLINGNTTKGE